MITSYVLPSVFFLNPDTLLHIFSNIPPTSVQELPSSPVGTRRKGRSLFSGILI